MDQLAELKDFNMAFDINSPGVGCLLVGRRPLAGPSNEEWERYKDVIIRLYSTENKPLKEVIHIMVTKYGFRATDRMFKSRLQAWKVRKNCSGQQMLRILRIKARRDAAGKKSAFRIKGIEVDPAKLRKFRQRKNIRESDLMTPASSGKSTPSDISCFTPILSPRETPRPSTGQTNPSSPKQYSNATPSNDLISTKSVSETSERHIRGRVSPRDLLALTDSKNTRFVRALPSKLRDFPINLDDDLEIESDDDSKSLVLSQSNGYGGNATDIEDLLPSLSQSPTTPSLPLSIQDLPQLRLSRELLGDLKLYLEDYFQTKQWQPFSQEPVNFDGEEISHASGRDAVSILEANNRIFDLKNPASLVTLYEVACLLFQRQDDKEAWMFADQGCRLIEVLLQQQHPQLLSSLFLVISMLEARGKSDLVDTLLNHAYGWAEILCGSSHPFTRVIACCSRAGPVRDALSDLGLNATCAIFNENIGAEHTHSLRLRYISAWALFYNGKLEEALNQFLDLKDIYERLTANDHLHARQALFAIGQVYAEQGNFSCAEEALRDVYERGENLFGKDPPLMINIEVLRMLAVIYRRQNKLVEMEMVLCKALGIGLHLLGREHPTVLLIRHELRSVI